MSQGQLRPKPLAEERRRPAAAPGQPKGPSTLVILRKSHRFLLSKLREWAADVHVLHRLWYKSAAQFRHMVWWRPVRRVKVLAARITTGSLAQSVPRMRSHPPTRRMSTPEQDEVVGVRLLRSIAEAYAAHWGDTPCTWDSLPKQEAPPRTPWPTASADAVREAAQALAEALTEMEQQSTCKGTYRRRLPRCTPLSY
ncbi:hypothetical protein MNAN1_002502 [Malassezia nana]|uniref:Uncharacterized protein n=1 Tax=Malassezia nana TaxID=180528 RepID=A0AAF0J7Y0_9BASI|nr:hypothetical protein MNAN1_002502 [Malassezia nana]